jgi:hypothetical protein
LAKGKTVRLCYEGGVVRWSVLEDVAASLEAAKRKVENAQDESPESGFYGLVHATDTLLQELRDSGAAPCLRTLYP